MTLVFPCLTYFTVYGCIKLVYQMILYKDYDRNDQYSTYISDALSTGLCQIIIDKVDKIISYR